MAPRAALFASPSSQATESSERWEEFEFNFDTFILHTHFSFVLSLSLYICMYLTHSLPLFLSFFLLSLSLADPVYPYMHIYKLLFFLHYSLFYPFGRKLWRAYTSHIDVQLAFSVYIPPAPPSLHTCTPFPPFDIIHSKLHRHSVSLSDQKRPHSSWPKRCSVRSLTWCLYSRELFFTQTMPYPLRPLCQLSYSV